MRLRLPVLLAGVALLGGCASTYTLTLMPRNSGAMYTGEAVERSSTEADVRITIGDKTYTGTWVYSGPDRTSAYVSGGVGIGSRRAIGGLGTVVTVDNPQGVEAKALLRAADGSGLRCDFKGLTSGRGGGGTCQDDQGFVYDVQIRFKEYK
jgi:hypothetical protein